MTNIEIASLLTETGLLLELDRTDVFRARAYRRAAQAAASWSSPLERLAAEELREIPGIGKSIASHIESACRTGVLPELEQLRRRFPAGLRELLRVPGLGPARARRLFESAGVSGLKGLRTALEDGALRGLPGFGATLERKLREGLVFAEAPSRRLRRDARRLIAPVLEKLRAMKGVSRAEPAGSLRRGRETVGNVDILAAAEDARTVIAAFTKLPEAESVLSRGPEKAAVRLLGGLQCDLRVVPPSRFGAALQYFTGSKEHNIALRALARRRGLTVSEDGVYRLSDKERRRPLAARTEEEVYAALGLGFIEPELREDRGELEAAAKGALPRLVRLTDVRGDFHNHSSHSDGRQTLEQMARAALERGYAWIALGDHSRSLRIAGGLSVSELRRTYAELDEARETVKGIELLRSMEVDILDDGSLDYPNDVLDELDIVIASVHSRFGMPGPEMTARLVRAAAGSRTDIIGHLSGRLINKRPPYDFDAEAVLRAAAESGAAIELNGQPDRLDADELRARRAKELGAPLALGSDAHSTAELSFIEESVVTARRAWLEPGDVLNCLTLRELRERLDDRAKRAVDAPLRRAGHERLPSGERPRRGRSLGAVSRRARRGQGAGAKMGLVARNRARRSSGAGGHGPRRRAPAPSVSRART